MLKLCGNLDRYYAELYNVTRQFEHTNNTEITYKCDFNDNYVVLDTISIDNQEYVYRFVEDEKTDLLRKRIFLRNRKRALYLAMSKHCNISLPWGCLTGVRPTTIGYEIFNTTKDIAQVFRILQSDYYVAKEKADLVGEVISVQQNYFSVDSKFYNLYIHIPFCPSRCNYCSFVSIEMNRQLHLVEQYVTRLAVEIRSTISHLRQRGKEIYSIYIGGGTPTALSPKQLQIILDAVGHMQHIEYTCEAGRPDTITREHLDIMREYGVSRVSVNPQSLSQRTLNNIGRNHTVADFYSGYELTARWGFDINVDIIAGIDDTEKEFYDTIDNVIKLQPSNITVHGLSLKRGSKLVEKNIIVDKNIQNMVEYSKKELKLNNYRPYYLYRQKNMLNNLENIGYCLDGKQCQNNITVMEEMLSVVACGAGGISKLIDKDKNSVNRFALPNDVKMYLEQFDERLMNKLKFFS